MRNIAFVTSHSAREKIRKQLLTSILSLCKKEEADWKLKE